MSPVEQAVDTYTRAATERDPAKQAALLAACWAEDGRLISRGAELRGLAAVTQMFARFAANPTWASIQVDAIDARGPLFRFRATQRNADGTTVEIFDAGEIDADGKIKTLLTFTGPLG